MVYPENFDKIRCCQCNKLDLTRYSGGLSNQDLIMIVNLLKERKDINTLVLCENELCDEHIKLLKDLKNTGIKKLHLDSNHITATGAKILGELIFLEELTLSGNQINDVGFIALLKLPALTELDIYNNGITENSIPAILRNTTLSKLSLDDQYMSEANLTRVFEHIANNFQKREETFSASFPSIRRSR